MDVNVVVYRETGSECYTRIVGGGWSRWALLLYFEKVCGVPPPPPPRPSERQGERGWGGAMGTHHFGVENCY